MRQYSKLIVFGVSIILLLGLVLAQQGGNSGSNQNSEETGKKHGLENTQGTNIKEDSGGNPTVGPSENSGNVPRATADSSKWINVEKGGQLDTKGYTGQLNFAEGGGKLNVEDSSGKVTSHEITKGNVVMKDGKIDSIKNGEVEKLDLKNSENGNKLEVKGDVKSYKSGGDGKHQIDSKNLEIKSSSKTTKFGKEGSKDEFNVELDNSKGKNDATAKVDSKGKEIDFSDKVNADGKETKGSFYGEMNFKTEGDAFNAKLKPSEGGQEAIAKIDGKFSTKVSQETQIENSQWDNAENSKNSISFNGNLDVKTGENNRMSLSMKDGTFKDINVGRINDNSQIKMDVVDGNNPNRFVKFGFDKGTPTRQQFGLDSIQSNLRTQFAENNKVYNLAMGAGNENPNIQKRNNVLALISQDDLASNPTRQDLIKNVISQPFQSWDKNSYQYRGDFLKGLNPNEITRLDIKTVKNWNDFKSALINKPKGVEYDEVLMSFHGDPQGFKVKATGARINADSFNSLTQGELNSIRSGFDSTAHCSGSSCLIGLNTETDAGRRFFVQENANAFQPGYLRNAANEVNAKIPKYYGQTGPSFSGTLSRALNLPVVASVPSVWIDHPSGTQKNIVGSRKWIVTTPSGGVSTRPPGFRLVEVLVRE